MSLKNILAIVFSVIFLAAVGAFVYFKVLPQINLFSTSSLAISTGNTAAQVYLNGRLIGTTPLRKEGLSYKKATVRVASPANSWEGSISFSPNAETTLNLELGTNQVFSGSDVVWLSSQNGQAGLTVISEPSEVLVTLDGIDLGKTPLSLNISSDPHIVKLSKEGYQGRSLNILARENYQLNINSHLFLLPIPSLLPQATPAATNTQVYSIVSKDDVLGTDFGAWAKAVSYWQSVYESSPSAIFTYLIDPNGVVYDRGGDVIHEYPATLPSKITIAYLTYPSETSLSESATTSLQKFLSGGVAPQVKILPTGQAWLRIRKEPDGEEVGKAEVGKTYTKISEQNGWTQIIYGNNLRGWVSSSYVEDVKSTEPAETP